VLFSEPKIPQCWAHRAALEICARFSALQRAENSSIADSPSAGSAIRRFSALQRAENSSIICCLRRCDCGSKVSVLFSEPKIPQCGRDFDQ